MKQSDDNRFIPMTSIDSGIGREVRPDVFYYTNQIVNVIMIGNPTGDWFLVDAGMPKCGAEIQKVAEKRFGKDHPPKAIILTHGHFDHVGGIVHLLATWDVPVYAHLLEFPYLTKRLDYPTPDTSVQGGLLAKISSIYPHEAIDITEALITLSTDHSITGFPGWKWIHAPGHSPGQIALFREEDGILLSADAMITVKQDSLYKVLLQREEVNGPPRYLTTDWGLAYESVKKLANLKPKLMISGHGHYMEGEELTHGIEKLVAEFATLAVPEYGRFVDPPARQD
jgi:glyoxylase-like metal-dependent hydrolase (beta-lactamase superfamily II)